MAGALALLAGCGATQPPSAVPSRQAAAYVDMTLGTIPQPPAGLTLLLAFVTAGPSGCTPTWGGILPLDDPAVLALVRQWRRAGHELRVSFGGELGTDLAEGCADERQLAAAYRQVVATLSPAVLDLDVEGAALADTAAVHRRSAALRLLQADADTAGNPVRVMFTLPAHTAGLTDPALALLADAHRTGVSVDAVNAMTMNYGEVPPDPAGTALNVASAVHAALAQLEPDADGAGLWHRVWVTPMIGRNDVAPEVFTLADADRLAVLAGAKDLGGVAFWSLARDRPCPSNSTAVSSTCSGVEAAPGAFAAALARFAAP
jgi:hypothetical protein